MEFLIMIGHNLLLNYFNSKIEKVFFFNTFLKLLLLLLLYSDNFEKRLNFIKINEA